MPAILKTSRGRVKKIERSNSVIKFPANIISVVTTSSNLNLGCYTLEDSCLGGIYRQKVKCNKLVVQSEPNLYKHPSSFCCTPANMSMDCTENFSEPVSFENGYGYDNDYKYSEHNTKKITCEEDNLKWYDEFCSKFKASDAYENNTTSFANKPNMEHHCFRGRSNLTASTKSFGATFEDIDVSMDFNHESKKFPNFLTTIKEEIGGRTNFSKNVPHDFNFNNNKHMKPISPTIQTNKNNYGLGRIQSYQNCKHFGTNLDRNNIQNQNNTVVLNPANYIASSYINRLLKPKSIFCNNNNKLISSPPINNFNNQPIKFESRLPIIELPPRSFKPELHHSFNIDIRSSPFCNHPMQLRQNFEFFNPIQNILQHNILSDQFGHSAIYDKLPPVFRKGNLYAEAFNYEMMEAVEEENSNGNFVENNKHKLRYFYEPYPCRMKFRSRKKYVHFWRGN